MIIAVLSVLYYSLLKSDAYGSTAATFFLLAEAERHRRMSLSPLTPSRIRKVSMPVLNPIVGPFQ